MAIRHSVGCTAIYGSILQLTAAYIWLLAVRIRNLACLGEQQPFLCSVHYITTTTAIMMNMHEAKKTTKM